MPNSCASSTGISTNGSGIELHVHRIVLGPVVVVLGETVSGADDVETVASVAIDPPES